MPIFFEAKKRKNRTFNLPRLIMLSTAVLATGLLLAGLALLSPTVLAPVEAAIMSAPAAELPVFSPAPYVYKVMVETGASGVIGDVVDSLAASMQPYMGEAVRVMPLKAKLKSEVDARFFGISYGVHMVVWKSSGSLMLTLIAPFNLEESDAYPYNTVRMPDTFPLASNAVTVTDLRNIILGVIAYEQGRYPTAVVFLDTFSARPTTGVNLATVALLQGNLSFNVFDMRHAAGALAAYNAVLTSDTTALKPYAYMNRGNTYYVTGDALAALEDYTAIESDDPALMRDATYNRGAAAESLHLYVEALDQYGSLSDEHYRDVRGRWLALSGSLEAERAPCIDRNDARVSASMNNSRMYKCLKIFDLAVENAQMAVNEHPSCYNYAWLGHITRLTGDLQVALMNFEQAVALCPDDYYARLGRGYITGLIDGTLTPDYEYTRQRDERTGLFTWWGSMFEEQGNVYAAGQNYWHWLQANGAAMVPVEFVGNQIALDASDGKVYLLKVSGRTGQKLSVTVASENPYLQDALLVVLDSAGHPIAGAGDRNIEAGDWNAQLAGLTLPADGEYTIAATDYGRYADTYILVTYSVR